VPVIVILTNFHTHLLFQINENHIYTRGPQFDFLMLYFIVSTLIADIKIFSNSRGEIDPVRMSQRKQIATFPLCLIAGWLFTLIKRNIPALCVCITVELLCLQIGSANRQILIDKLTQVNNRQNLSRFVSNKLRSHTGDLFLLMIDVDYFTSINDNFGHLEGDEALIRVANALKQGCTSCRKRPYIARYGGDEFIIITELSEEETLELCSSIKNKLKELNDNAGVRYSLNLSIGCAEWKSGMTANDLINTADFNLYKEKAARDRNPENTGMRGRRSRKTRPPRNENSRKAV
jgi:diguanylate cyclase (GGDEF)-like protein